MDDAFLVRGFERVGNLPRDRSASSSGSGPCAMRSASVDPSTSSITSARTPPLLEAVDRRDVGMIQCGERLRLAPESGEAVRVVREGSRQNLQGDIAIQPSVASPVHLAHAAGAEERDDLVGTDACRGGKHPVGWIIGV